MARKFCALTAALMIAALFLPGCTTSIGKEDPGLLADFDFGPPQEVKMCVYLDDGISQETAQTLLSSWSDEAAKYNLFIKPVQFESHSRSGFFYWQIMSDVNSIPLQAPCDRVIYFANRNVGDFAYGMLSLGTGLPEILGFVDDQTLTHGFVYASVATFSQLLISPTEATRHELYHLLGCGQHGDMAKCYGQIKQLKDSARGKDFYPTFEDRGEIVLDSREQVNSKLNSAVNGKGTATSLGL